jgi:hypothetical protein
MSVNKQKNQDNIKPIIDINILFPDIDEWPDSWAGLEYDIPVGKRILNEFKAFLNQQKTRLTKKTLKDYGNYLWALGGEIIRDTSWNEKKVQDLDDDFILNYVDECGGPYWRHATNEKDHDRYHSICRRFYKYLKNK